MLIGEFQHNIDAKGRIIVPSKMRSELGGIFMAAAVLDRCVTLYPMAQWEKLMEKLMEQPLSKVRRLQRYIGSKAQEVQLDSQGRILLAKNLMEHAGIEKDILIIGACDRAEIWNPDLYKEDMDNMTLDEVEAEFIEIGF